MINKEYTKLKSKFEKNVHRFFEVERQLYVCRDKQLRQKLETERTELNEKLEEIHLKMIIIEKSENLKPYRMII